MVRLDAIVFDAGTQVRESINEQVVADYADRLHEGVEFPPVILFHDGNRYYMADGFHRGMAHLRLGREEIAAEVKPGTREDALWFALGANKANGQRMTEADKKHAVAVALRAWPEKMQREIAEQVGCHPSLVSNVYQKTIASEPVLRGRALATERKKDIVRELVAAGVPQAEIAKRAKVGNTVITDVRAELGLSRGVDKSKQAVAERRERIKELAALGYTTRQIAATVDIDVKTVSKFTSSEGIDVPADTAVGKSKRHDSNRIVGQIVADAENLTAGADLIDFSALDRSHIAEWVASLQSSRDALGAFIRRLSKEQQHGQVA